MNEERLEDKKTNNSSADVSAKNGFLKIITRIFAKIGFSGVKVLTAVLMGIIKSLKFICTEVWELIRSLMSGIRYLFKAAAIPFKKRMKITFEMQKSLRRAKKQGKKAYIHELIRCVGTYLFGEEGVCYTAFNYILPVISAAFLIGVISYGSGLEYGICVEYNGQEIGIISAEADFDTAAREVQQRITFSEDDEAIDLSPKFSLKIISDDENYVNPSELADQMLAVSDKELSEAYGIYVDGNFIGAVEDKKPIEDVLADMLLNYEVDGAVKDISFQNKIEYTQGIYLTESIMTETEAINLLTSQKHTTAEYVVQKDESPLIICMKYDMSLEDLLKFNPTIAEKCEEGQLITVVETERYLPIQYVREMETVSLLDYDTVEVETSSLNVGTTSTLVKGEKGERRSTVEVTYIDGMERARKVISSEVTKEPVTEQIGIGTYSARPASEETLINGTGEFGWPVNGGYISDTFISDRNHKGLDIAAAAGTDIYAAADGVVISSGWNPNGYGYFVMIDHQNGYQTLYGHCSMLYAVEGQTVTRGQLIAAVGSTGDSTGNHCHFEVRYLGVCYDPCAYLNTSKSFEAEDVNAA